MREINHSEPEIWLACQGSVTSADGCDGFCMTMMSAPILVYIVGGRREILASVAPWELRQV